MKQILNRLFEHECLDRAEARDIMLRISRGECNDSQIAAFITVFLMRSITIEELSGFRDALLELRVPLALSDYPAIDIVGPGGDNKNPFNISPAACFVLAGAGSHVVKHGNYGPRPSVAHRTSSKPTGYALSPMQIRSANHWTSAVWPFYTPSFSTRP